MSTFQPSLHSSYGGISDAAAGIIGAGVQVAGMVASTAITVSAAAQAQKSQQKHELGLAKAQENLLKLQNAATAANASSTQAQAAVEVQASSNTLYVVGGVVLSVVALSGAAMLIFRKPSPRDDSEEEDEE